MPVVALEGTLYQRFAATVSEFGDHPALEAGPDRMTYRQLSELAERLAGRALEQSGAVPGRVGVLAGRGVLGYAGYLAALRIGAAVVPLNPAHPPARNASIATSGRLDMVLADHAVTVPIPAPVIRLDTGGPSAGSAPRPPAARPGDVAYILFTSGSTGTPKGVPVAHSGVSAFLAHATARHEAGPGSRLAQTFDLSFDLSVIPMWAAWGTGGTMVVASPRDLLAPARFVAEREITHWYSVPSVISLARQGRGLSPASMPGLRWSVFCGEQLTVQQAQAWHAAAPNSVLDNVYGPTEATVFCTGYRLPGDPARWPRTANGTLPIGGPCPGVEVMVLGDDGRPGQEGELCVRGAQRFAGYLDPANDNGRFVEFDGERARDCHGGTGAVPARAWYRTGDRVMVDHGELVHLGRFDQQVKIGGYRVELGEIEAALRHQPGVTDAVVVVLPGGDGEADLLAACTCADPGDWDPGKLLVALHDWLPEYMVPVDLVLLPEFPRNANGKVDRAAVASALGTGPA
jgi:amino acid adenylation domain-containing protein